MPIYLTFLILKKMHLLQQKFITCLALATLLFTACEQADWTELTPEQDLNQQQLTTASDLSQVDDSYIVVLNKDLFTNLNGTEKVAYDTRIERVEAVAQELLSSKNVAEVKIGQVYGKVFQGFNTKLTAEEAENLAKDSRVAYVEQDQIMSINPIVEETGVTMRAQTTPYGITRVNGGNTTSNVTGWVIDTGIDLNHEDLNVDIDRSISYASLDPFGFFNVFNADDQQGHGSHVAGTMAAIDNNVGVIGVAPGATVVAVKVLDALGSGFNSNVIKGVDYVAANAAAGDVANMSLGGGASPALDDAVKAAAAQGILFALAAGNDSEHANNSSPARANGANIYTVSAMDINDNFASFSNFGNPPVDVCAPGVGTFSTSNNGGYATLSGTSMASPHVAGLLMIGALSFDGTVNNDPDGQADPIPVH